MDTNLALNTCYIGIQALSGSIRNIAYYSHLIPVFFSLLLGFLVLFKARNILSKIFFAFSLVFSFWLIGDLLTWVPNNYYLIYATWSLLVYIEISFFILCLYFIIVFVRKSDVSLILKILLFFPTLIPLYLTITQQSVSGFNHPVCEAFNNHFLDTYKLYLEIIILLIILVYFFVPFIKKSISFDKKSHIIVLGSTFLFLAVFGVTEYISANTASYELNLYALFIIPVFLIAITYSIFRLDIFNIKIISTYFLVFGFFILTATQLLFINSTTDRLLSIVTLILSVFISFLLFRNLRKESEQRIQIEKLNTDLEKLIQQRESLMHLINHKVKGSFTHSKYIFAGLLDGMFGVLTPEIKKIAQMGLDSDTLGIKTIDLILNAANLQSKTINYDMKPTDFKEIILNVVAEKKEVIQKKEIELETNIAEGEFKTEGDTFWLKEVVNNLVDNALNYTSKGKIIVGLEKKVNKIIFSVKDTGVGITEEDRKNLFTEGGRGKDALRTNVNSTGYGLYSVKLIVEAHKGRVWVESGGRDMGSQFFVEFNAI